tara:strand:- start:166 stop:351 length:186 start_codon:yes stop_codon:yes gene_type:complete
MVHLEANFKKVTITSDEKEEVLKAEVLLHRLDVDGSEIILIKTQPRDTVVNFIYNEVVEKD